MVRCVIVKLSGGCFCAIITILENHNNLLQKEKRSSFLFCIWCLFDFSRKSGEVASADSPRDSTVLLCVDVKQSDVWWFQTYVCLLVTTFQMPEDFASILDKQRIGPTTEKLIESDFPAQSFQPKVQVAFKVLPGQCPRRVEIER